MLSNGVRQVPYPEARTSCEPVAEVSGSVADELVQQGVLFTEEREYDEPGPARWALVELEDGTEFLLVHHTAHPRRMLEMRAPAVDVAPATLLTGLFRALDLMPDDYHVSDGWPERPGG
jgi:hypothetical protein